MVGFLFPIFWRVSYHVPISLFSLSPLRDAGSDAIHLMTRPRSQVLTKYPVSFLFLKSTSFLFFFLNCKKKRKRKPEKTPGNPQNPRSRLALLSAMPLVSKARTARVGDNWWWRRGVGPSPLALCRCSPPAVCLPVLLFFYARSSGFITGFEEPASALPPTSGSLRSSSLSF